MQRRRTASRQHLDDWALIAATPIVFPLSWAHHFLFVTPLAAALAAESMADAAGHAGHHRPLIVAAVATALVIPAFEIFPLGTSRLAGAIMLLGAWSRVRVAT
jgi:hypothetical protein